MNHPATLATILVVDDSESIRILVRAYLQEAEYRVLEAVNGLSGLDICRRQPPDLILLDIFMPEMDGFELCARLQKEKLLSNIPVIMLTAVDNSETKTRAFTLGAVDYLTKPFNKEEILARIRTHLKISSLNHSLQQANRVLRANQEQLMQGIQAAAELQKNLLPKRVPDCKSLRFTSYFRPCQGVGGDIYNVQRLDDEHLAFSILDVSGHGFPAAIMTALATQALSPSGGIVKKASLRDSRQHITAPRKVLQNLDREFPIERFNLYMTIAYLLLNTRNNTFHYSCAGHPPPLHLSNDGTITLLDTGGPPAGLGGLGGSWLEGQGHLGCGERIFFYTDGLTQHTNEEKELYSQDRLIDSIRKSRDLSLQAAVQNIIGELKQFGNQAEPDDDITLLAVERLE
ncbi:MAG: fused response regulator/phosphatase [Proteobacteria bacterium]|nr:fused response regulator/phosphatase [Pseudomonadota bacterium]MBU1060021.1 fused response regulator/phosphatase [Pseudomonadota bacterium]